MTRAFIGMGSNMGDRLGRLCEALTSLDAEPGTRVVSVSRVYETEPWGIGDQPLFANAVALIDYRGEADALLAALKSIEESMGRAGGVRFGPRPIDLDVLLFGDEEWASDALTIPHPRMLEREFVVVPLLEMAPGTVLPDGTPVRRQDAREGRVVADLGELPGFQRSPGPAEHGGERREDVTSPDVPGVEGWVVVGPGRYEYGAGNTSTDFDLLMYESFLVAAGIPVAFQPHRPNETLLMHPGIRETVRMMVPARYAEEARGIIADLEADEDE